MYHHAKKWRCFSDIIGMNPNVETLSDIFFSISQA